MLIESLRRRALHATRFAQATAATIRLKLLKIGALVKLSVRRVTIAMSSAHPYQAEFNTAWHALHAAAR